MAKAFPFQAVCEQVNWEFRSWKLSVLASGQTPLLMVCPLEAGGKGMTEASFYSNGLTVFIQPMP
jgi:hypothetical protein